MRGINFSLDEGKVLVIIGLSGSGKTTILLSLNLLEIPEKGFLGIDGKQANFSQLVAKKTIREIRRKSAMVFQGYNLFPHKTVLENVIEGPVSAFRRAAAAGRYRTRCSTEAETSAF